MEKIRLKRFRQTSHDVREEVLRSMLHGIQACSRGVCICYSTNRKFSIHYTHTTCETGTVPLDEISRSPPIHQFKHADSSYSESSRLHDTVNGSLPFVSATRRTQPIESSTLPVSLPLPTDKIARLFFQPGFAALGRWLARVLFAKVQTRNVRFDTRQSRLCCKPLRNQLAPKRLGFQAAP